jgi:hypothetical protein
MKKLVILGVLLLVGCAATPFDNIEYNELNKIYTYAGHYKSDCGDLVQTKTNINTLALASESLANYGADFPDDAVARKAFTDLDTLVQRAATQLKDPHSKTFCETKFDMIRLSTGVIKSAIAQRKK